MLLLLLGSLEASLSGLGLVLDDEDSLLVRALSMEDVLDGLLLRLLRPLSEVLLVSSL